MLHGVERYYVERLLKIVPLYRVVLRLGILLGLVQDDPTNFISSTLIDRDRTIGQD